MKVKIIDYGFEHAPFRAHANDAGSDVYACLNKNSEVVIEPHSTYKVPLGFGLCVPDGYAAFVFPRSGLSSKGITCELPPIDSGYRGEIHAIVHNGSEDKFIIKNGERIGQLIIMPIIIFDCVNDLGEQRGINAFGSTGI